MLSAEILKCVEQVQTAAGATSAFEQMKKCKGSDESIECVFPLPVSSHCWCLLEGAQKTGSAQRKNSWQAALQVEHPGDNCGKWQWKWRQDQMINIPECTAPSAGIIQEVPVARAWAQLDTSLKYSAAHLLKLSQVFAFYHGLWPK